MSLLLVIVLSQVTLSDEGGAKKLVNHLNCVGEGITCSATSTFGTITVGASDGGGGGGASYSFIAPLYADAGSVLCAPANGLTAGCLLPADWSAFNAKERALTFTAPLSRTVDTVSCTAASASVGGCVTTGDQDFAGNKVHNGLVQMTNLFPRALGPESVNVSQINYAGVMLNGPLLPRDDNNPVILQSRKLNSDVGAGVIVQETYFRDAGSIFSVLQGQPCRTQLFGISPNGNVTWSPAPQPNCADATDILERGVLTHGNTASGAVALQSADERYLVLRGRLARIHNGYLPDGGRPVYDGGRDVRVESDGGTYYAYAGAHGNVSLSTPEAQYGGWLFEVRNSDGFGASKFVIDSYGGIAQVHGMAFSQFPECPGVAIASSLGQFSRGAADGELLWASDQQHWYICRSSGWKKVVDESDIVISASAIGSLVPGVVDAGRVLENGVRVASSAIDPLVLTDGTLSCTPAAAGQAGCVSTATQTFQGSKYVTGTFGINGSVSGGAFGDVSLLSTKGIAIGDRISPYNAGAGIIITGDRAAPDLAGTLVVESARWRDAGVLFNVQYPTCSGSSAFSVTDQGIYYGQALQPGCTSASNPFIGGLVDYSTASGHISHRAVEDYYLTLGGSLGHRTDAVQPDGGRPAWVDGGSIGVLPDGGTYYQYGGEHGDVGLVSIYPRTRGFIAELYNPNSGTNARTDHKAFFDWNGSYSQNHGLEITQFPPIATTSTDTNLGSFFNGALPSSIYYDSRSKPAGGQQWYFAQDQGDGGGEYARFIDTSALPSCSNATASKLLYDTTTRSFSCGTDQTGGGGGGSANFVADAFGFTDSSDALKTVTAAWATTSSNIMCGPLGEEESVEDLRVTVIARASGSFTARGYVPTGRHTGTMNFRCTGD